MTLQNSDYLKHKAFSNPLRIRMVEHLGTPRTVKEIAVEMDMLPHTLYHHIKVLQECGVVELVHQEKLRGSIEKKYYLLTAGYRKPDKAATGDSNEIIRQAQAIIDEHRDRLIRTGQLVIASNSLVTIHSDDAKELNEKLSEGLRQLLEKCLKPYEATDGDMVYVLNVLGFIK